MTKAPESAWDEGAPAHSPPGVGKISVGVASSELDKLRPRCIFSLGSGKYAMNRHNVLDWLLEEDQPAIRYITLTELLDKPANDPDVRETREMIAKHGGGAALLREQLPGGYWASTESLYGPKYVATNWRLLVLADLTIRMVQGG